MKKKLFIFLAAIALFLVSVYTVRAVDPDHPENYINVTVVDNEAAGHGRYDLRIDESHLEEAINETGYKANLVLEADPGYYIKDLQVKFGDEDLELGFEAASEQGMFFRRAEFYPLIDEFQFFIPDGADETHKVQVTIEVAEKNPFDIVYKNYTGENFDDDSYSNMNNYGEENALVGGYKDGDVILTNSCIDKGCLVEFRFGTDEVYNEYKNSKQRLEGNGPADPWFSTRAYNSVDNEEEFLRNDCDDEEKVCSFIVKKDFNKVLIGEVHIGYTTFDVYSPNYIGFDVKGDVANFEDVLMETGRGSIGFDENNLETDITLFYGTKKLKLIKKSPNELVKTGVSNCGELDSFDDVSGEGFGYSTSYAYDDVLEKDVATISIDSYYQDKMILELTLKKNGNNIFGDNKVKIELNRFAFGGNGMELLETDSLGRNCREANNNNTCDNGIYYSTQYRGVLKAFYVAEDAVANEHFTDYYDISSITGTTIAMQIGMEIPVYPRNKDFNPHAVALYYDRDGMIVDTAVFDLNAEVYFEGIITKETFLDKYGDFDRNIDELSKGYVYFGHTPSIPIANKPMMEDIEYFEGHLEDTLMHDMILISKDEAQEKGITKITLFLVNGEVEEDNIPELTFGTGEGIVLQIRQEHHNQQNQEGGD